MIRLSWKWKMFQGSIFLWNSILNKKKRWQYFLMLKKFYRVGGLCETIRNCTLSTNIWKQMQHQLKLISTPAVFPPYLIMIVRWKWQIFSMKFIVLLSVKGPNTYNSLSSYYTFENDRRISFVTIYVSFFLHKAPTGDVFSKLMA